MKGLNKPIWKTNYKNNKEQNKQTARSLFKLCSQVFPNSAPEDLPWWKRRRRGRRKSTRMDLVMGKKKGRQKKTPVKEERKKQGHIVPASVLTPNTLVSY